MVYTTRTSNGNTASFLPYLSWWNTGYNDLTNVAFANNSTSVAEIALIPAAGFSVTLNSFDLGAYFLTTGSSQWTIYDSAYNPLASSGSISVGSGATTHYTTAPRLTNSNRLILQWGPNAYNAGIDNFNFTTQPTSIVPEPSTMLFLATGLVGILGYGWRRKRAA